MQLLDELGGASTAAYLFNTYSFIAVDTANAANLFAARGLQATLRNTTHLRLALVPLRSVFATKAAIVSGALDDPNTTALAAGRNLTAAVPTEPRAAGLFAAALLLTMSAGTSTLPPCHQERVPEMDQQFPACSEHSEHSECSEIFG